MEVRRPNEKYITTKFDDLFYYSESSKGQRGVGFLIKPEISNHIIEIGSESAKCTK